MVLIDCYKQMSAKWVKKYHCSNCDYTHLENVGYGKPSGLEHQIGIKEIRCPKCKSMGKDDFEHKLKVRIEALTKQKSNIEIEIEELTRQLGGIETEAKND